MAKAVADVEGESQGGYSPDGSKIKGFSHMHDSGTGGVNSLGNFPIFPLTGCIDGKLSDCVLDYPVHAVNDSVKSYPGYFAITLETGVVAEMTTAEHTALYRFTYSKKAKQGDVPSDPVIIAEPTDLSRTNSQEKLYYNSTTGRLSGQATFIPSFGTGHFKLAFCADFSGAKVKHAGAYSGTGELGYYNDTAGTPNTFSSTFNPHGIFVQFDPKEEEQAILARVGVSFISIEKACANAESEIPSFDFDATLSHAKGVWKEKLDVVDISTNDGVSEDLRTVFWSGVYRVFISPQDYTGENPLWKSDEPYFDSFYCLWDSFRAQHPFLTMLDPDSQTLMVRGLIDIYRHEGWMPDCRMSLCQGWVQGGSNADVVLADAYIKGLTNGINWTTGYEAVLKDAEIEPPRWDLVGRGGLVSWKEKGYIPIDDQDYAGFGPHTRSVSRTVEYAYNDFSVAQIARGMNKTEDYQKYMERSGNWKNLLRLNQSSELHGEDLGFDGVLQPRYFNGSWAFQHPLLCSPLLEPDACFLTMDGHETYEGSAWLYTFFVPGDTAALISALGSKEDFVRRLDFLHESGMLYMGDEQAFLTTFLYHYAGRPGLSAKRVHTYIPSQFNNTYVGIPGNDDSGAMGAYASLTMMGVFPNAGQNVYFITPPFFREVSIRHPQTGKTATIRNVNFDATYKNIYIQSATLDGYPYTKSWIDHAFFLDGGVLELVLGDRESSWGTADEDLPPSLSTTGPNNGTWVSSIFHFTQ